MVPPSDKFGINYSYPIDYVGNRMENLFTDSITGTLYCGNSRTVAILRAAPIRRCSMEKIERMELQRHCFGRQLLF